MKTQNTSKKKVKKDELSIQFKIALYIGSIIWVYLAYHLGKQAYILL